MLKKSIKQINICHFQISESNLFKFALFFKQAIFCPEEKCIIVLLPTFLMNNELFIHKLKSETQCCLKLKVTPVRSHFLAFFVLLEQWTSMVFATLCTLGYAPLVS